MGGNKRIYGGPCLSEQVDELSVEHVRIVVCEMPVKISDDLKFDCLSRADEALVISRQRGESLNAF
jgi:hypothetical protein